MRQEFAIDALVQYGEEEADPDREIPNPAWTDADKKLKTAKKKLRRLEADYGAAAADNPEKQRPTMRGFKIAHGKELGVPLREQRQRVDQFQQDRDALPKRTTVGQLAVDQRPVRLPERRKRLSDGLKMLAYQVESDLVRAITLHYKRVDDEGRTLIAAAMRSGGDIDLAEGELRITLAPQSSPHRSRVIAELCRVLDQTETRFPGTDGKRMSKSLGNTIEISASPDEIRQKIRPAFTDPARLRKTDRQIEGLALLDVTSRISETLLQLATEGGVETDAGILIKERPTHQDLANMSGTTRETVSRVLKRLEAQGYIASKGRSLTILREENWNR